MSRHAKPHSWQPAAIEPKSYMSEHDGVAVSPSADAIRVRAYEISQARDGGAGTPDSDWTQAERELKGGLSAKN